MNTRDPALARLIDQVLPARQAGTVLDIRGGGTKAFYGGVPRGEPLQLHDLAGVSSHEPTEPVITARAGTLLSALEAALGEHGRCLPFSASSWHAQRLGGTAIHANDAASWWKDVRDQRLASSTLPGCIRIYDRPAAACPAPAAGRPSRRATTCRVMAAFSPK